MTDKYLIRDGIEFKKISWLDKYMIGHDGFIAGGCFKNIFNDEPVKDIDIFFCNEEDYIRAKSYFNEEYHDTYYENQKVIAYKDGNLTIELIHSVFGSPEEVINDFDFSITKFAYYKYYDEENESYEYKIIHHPKYFEHLLLKRLVVEESLKYPNGTFERMLRYVKYGYSPCKESKMNIIKAIKSSNNETDVLSESLYDGVD